MAIWHRSLTVLVMCLVFFSCAKTVRKSDEAVTQSAQQVIEAPYDVVWKSVREEIRTFPEITANSEAGLITTGWDERREANLMGTRDADAGFTKRVDENTSGTTSVIIYERFVIQVFAMGDSSTSVTVRWTYMVHPNNITFQTIEEPDVSGRSFLNDWYNTHEEVKLLAKIKTRATRY